MIDEQRDHAAGNHGCNHIGNAGKSAPEDDAGDQRGEPHGGRVGMDITDMLDEVQQLLRQVQAAGHIDTEKVLQLAGPDQNSRTGGEAHHHRVGDEIHQRTEAGDPHGQLDDTHHEGERQRIGDVVDAARIGQHAQG